MFSALYMYTELNEINSVFQFDLKFSHSRFQTKLKVHKSRRKLSKKLACDNEPWNSGVFYIIASF